MSESEPGVVEAISAIFLLYVLFLVGRELLPLLRETEFGQSVISGSINAFLFVSLAAIVYVILRKAVQ